MGSNRVGEEGPKSGRPSSSSRRGKKSNPDKPKQPQRGLGVAQLEKIRIQSQLMAGYHPPSHHPHFHSMDEDAMRSFPSSSSSSSASALSVHPNPRMGFGDNLSSHNYGFGDHHYSSSTSYSQLYDVGQETLPLMEDCYSATSFNRRSDSEDSQEVDLELRLSL